MQQIERYGVIALVFLLVTIVAISFWGDSKSPGFWSRLTGKNQPKNEVAKVEPQALPSQIANPDLALSPAAPLGTPQPIDSLGGAQPLTSIDAPATGSSTLQPPENQLAIGTPPPAAGAGAMVPMNTPNAPVATPGTIVAPPPAAPASGAEYMVQRGDSLARIARTRLGSESRWQEIAALNPNVNPKNLSVGQKLVMPTGAATYVPVEPANRAEPRSTPKPKTTAKATPASAEKPKSEKSSGARVCTVQKGDTLRSIARRELGDERRWKEIAGLNPSIDPSKLAIGQRVKLPSKGGELIAAVPASSSSSSKPRVR